MLKLKGIYEWKLIDAATHKVVKEGTQENLISDFMLNALCHWTQPQNFGWAIELSRTIPTDSNPLSYYRREWYSDTFDVAVKSPGMGVTTDFNANTVSVGFNFSPPSPNPITIHTIGIQDTNWIGENFISFIQLSSPITQATNQYLYVKYTMFFQYVSGGYNTSTNHYIDYLMSKGVMRSTFLNFGSWCAYRITPFLPPDNVNNLMRPIHYYRYSGQDFQTITGSRYGVKSKKDFTITQIPGPIGTLVYNTEQGSDPWWDYCTWGYSQIKSNLPSVSRIFVHPVDRISQIFSDPAYPASSNGTITINNLPNNTFPIIGRISITKTGDASNIVDDSISVVGFPTHDMITTIDQSALWTTGDIVQFTGQNLPAPLLTMTDYYVVSWDATTIRISASPTLTPLISFSSTGTGIIIRQNTGEYQLELEPWLDHGGTYDIMELVQLPMGIDTATKAQRQNLYDSGDMGEGGINDGTVLIRGYAKIGETVWTVQKSGVSPRLLNICKWKFNSVETSLTQTAIPNTDTVDFRCMYSDGIQYIYMALDDGLGLYKYDTQNPTIPPVRLTLTEIPGMIDTNIMDLAYDSVTHYLWTGHTAGLSRIDLTTMTATQYIQQGQLLNMTDDDVAIQPGQLEAYNGRILRCGLPNGGPGGLEGWVMDDAPVATWRHIDATMQSWHTGCIRKGTNDIVGTCKDIAEPNIRWKRYSVVTAGKGDGFGSSTLHEDTHLDDYRPWSNSQIIQLSDDTFQHWSYFSGGGWGNWSEYTLKLGVSGTLEAVTRSPVYDAGPHDGWQWQYAMTRGGQMEIGHGLKLFCHWFNVIMPSTGFSVSRFGWDGSTWIPEVGGLSTSRKIPSPGPHDLLDNLTVNFNNAEGKPYNQQFVQGDRFTFVYAPFQIKDNLQTAQIQCRTYFGKAVVKGDSIPVSYPVPVATYPSYTIPEAPDGSSPDVDFRDMDNTDYLTEVWNGTPGSGTRFTAIIPPSNTGYSVDVGNNLLNVGRSIDSGTPIRIISDDRVPKPLIQEGLYFAIHYGSTTIQLALSYADATAPSPIPIVLTDGGSGSQYYSQLTSVTTGLYYAGCNGKFLFSSSDAGDTLRLIYTYTQFS